jgi:hypothetical protein
VIRWRRRRNSPFNADEAAGGRPLSVQRTGRIDLSLLEKIGYVASSVVQEWFLKPTTLDDDKARLAT